MVARERPASRSGRLPGPVVLGPLHGQGRPDGPRRGGLDDPGDGRRADVARDGGTVRAERHEPPSRARRPDGVHAADREWRATGPGDRASAGRRGSTPPTGWPFRSRPSESARLEEAIAVIRALWTGGPVTRESPYYPLVDAAAYPIPNPPPPIVIGGETPAGARLAGRIGDGWSAFDNNFEANLPLYLEALEAAGRKPRGPARHRRVPGRLAGRGTDRRQPVDRGAARDLGPLARRRRGRGHRPGQDDRRRGRASGGHRPLVADRSPGSGHQPP